jgi:hypothetical protein
MSIMTVGVKMMVGITMRERGKIMVMGEMVVVMEMVEMVVMEMVEIPVTTMVLEGIHKKMQVDFN